MSHYEERLEGDLKRLRRGVHDAGKRVLEAQKLAVRALLEGDRDLAAKTALDDLAINRLIRSLDRDCHVFVARHLPSAGHLRFVSSVLRLNVGLERIGDYAATLCRLALQLTEEPPEVTRRDIELMADLGQRTLRQALEAWDESNPELARGTIGMAQQAAGASNRTFADLLQAGQEGTRPLADLFALLVVFNRLDRVVAQAKNICEETLFSVLGETKAPKVYRVLFVDERGNCESQLAAAYARKAFPNSGRYSVAGWNPEPSMESRCSLFMDRCGLVAGEEKPRPLEELIGHLEDFHVIVSLGGDLRPHVPAVPYQTIVLNWDLGPSIDGLDQERAEQLLEKMFKEVVAKVGDLMEALHGEEAH